MASLRDSSRTSTVLSKTTTKVIMKKSHVNGKHSGEEKGNALARKIEALEENRRKAAGTPPLKQAPAVPSTQAVSYASTLQNKAGENTASNASIATRGPMPTSNTDYQKLQRPPAIGRGVSAISGLQISGRSALGSISNNCLPGAAHSTFVSRGARATDKVHSPREFEVGVIFSTATHQRDFATALDPNNTNQSMTNFGIVHSKYRKFVVIARFATHVLALPIYTHGGRGLANKPHKKEFVSIRDIDARGQAAMAESSHDIIWAERYPSFKGPNVTPWYMMSNMTSVHLTAPYSHSLDVKCTISGELEQDSIKYLQKLFGEATIAAFESRSVKSTPDADGFRVVRPSPSRAGSTYSRQGSAASVLRGRDSWRPSYPSRINE